MFRDSRPIALRKLMPFSNRKHRTSDSIHSDEDPLLDEEAAVIKTSKNKFGQVISYIVS
jgi:phospholipid-translocating ATPase